MWSAAILAGGTARRFGGRDKSGLVVDGQSILSHQLAMLRGLTDHVFVVANDPIRYATFGVEVVRDLVPGAGSLGGIYTAIMSAPTDGTVVIACDMPFVTGSFLRHLVEQAGDADVTIPRAHNCLHPMCAAYSRRCAAAIRRRLDVGALKVTAFLDDVTVREIGPEEVAMFDPDGLLLANINTPDDYARAIAARRTR
jgi:molybdopterin-guanine dinucleotide biosynthesis protein A